MSPKRNERVAAPAARDEWELRFATNEAARGWENLCRQAPENTRKAWIELRGRARPCPPAPRNHQLKGSRATAIHGGAALPQWQFEVTGGGRIWYLVDDERRTLWIKFASTGHPKLTD